MRRVWCEWPLRALGAWARRSKEARCSAWLSCALCVEVLQGPPLSTFTTHHARGRPEATPGLALPATARLSLICIARCALRLPLQEPKPMGRVTTGLAQMTCTGAKGDPLRPRRLSPRVVQPRAVFDCAVQSRLAITTICLKSRERPSIFPRIGACSQQCALPLKAIVFRHGSPRRM